MYIYIYILTIYVYVYVCPHLKSYIHAVVLSPSFSPAFHVRLWRLVCAGGHQHCHFYHRVTTAGHWSHWTLRKALMESDGIYTKWGPQG